VSPARLLKIAWAAPCSAVGLVLAAVAVATGGHVARRHGALEAAFDPARPASRRIASRLPFRGIALGHVIVAADARDLDRLRAHEHVHVRQCERWGPFFFPAYLAAGAWAWARGLDPYWDNPFEVEARERSATAGSRRSAGGTPPPPS
jgi:hypothetical protein